MRVLVDLSEVRALVMRAEDELKSIPSLMKRIEDLGAAEERQTHAYRNRTYRLQRSTKARVVSGAMRVTRVDLEMGMPYASYIVARGLSSINRAVYNVRRQLEEEFEDLAKRISR